MEDTPNFIMLLVVSMILIGIGLFIMVTFTSTVGLESSSTEEFAVTNPSVDLTVSLKYTPKAEPSVIQYNGIDWTAVDGSFVSYSGNLLTVAAGGMQG